MKAFEAFLDINVLLYLLSGDTAKANRAEELIAAGGVMSVQALNEFASVASRKLGMSWAEIREVLETVRAMVKDPPTSTLLQAEKGEVRCERQWRDDSGYY